MVCAGSAGFQSSWERWMLEGQDVDERLGIRQLLALLVLHGLFWSSQMNLSKIVGFFPPVLAINVMHLLLHNYPVALIYLGFLFLTLLLWRWRFPPWMLRVKYTNLDVAEEGRFVFYCFIASSNSFETLGCMAEKEERSCHRGKLHRRLYGASSQLLRQMGFYCSGCTSFSA